MFEREQNMGIMMGMDMVRVGALEDFVPAPGLCTARPALHSDRAAESFQYLSRGKHEAAVAECYKCVNMIVYVCVCARVRAHASVCVVFACLRCKCVGA